MAGPRYLRYIVFAVVCIGIIFFISSSSSSSSSGQPTSAGGKIKETLQGKVPNVQLPDTNDIKETLKDQVGRVQVPDADDIKETVKGQVGKVQLPGTNDIKNAIVGTGSDTTPQLPEGQVPSRPETLKNLQDQDAPPRGQEPVPNSGDSRPAAAPARKPADTSTSKPPTSANTQGKLGPAKAPGPRMNATFVTLARNSDLWEIVKSIRQVEDRFNRKFNYDWVFLNEKPFDDEFVRVTSSLVSGQTKYGLIPEEHWSFPEWIDQDKAAAVRKDMADRQIIYGDSISYRHMCRFESGFFFRQPLMLEYEWYWRVEPSIELYCDVDYDAFRFMADNGKKYSFVISLFEYRETIPTLWDSTKKFMSQHPEYIAKDNSMAFISDDKGKTYNNCHFWSNFEIGNLNWLRSNAYIDYFTSLDRDGGFFYERWGDAPVHSIAAALLLPKDQIHFFNDIAYYHVPFTHCPSQEQLRIDNKCHCKPSENFDWNGYSCTNKFYDLHGMKKPAEANQ